MANNKIVLNDGSNNGEGTVLLDLTSDTVTPNTLMAGVTAHDASGEEIEGALAGVFTKYGTCSTSASTATKVVTLSNATGWTLQTGAVICVKFSNTNTASNPKLNVNSSTAKSIRYNNATVTTTNLERGGYSSKPSLYMYDGMYWVWLGWSSDYESMSSATATAGTSTTPYTITASILKSAVMAHNPSTSEKNAGAHNAVFRGKNLGASVTAEQWSAISAGEFDDMYIGDFWRIPVQLTWTNPVTTISVDWLIAGFNYWLGAGNSEMNIPHIAMVPDIVLFNSVMNSSTDVTGAYVGSAFCDLRSNNSSTGLNRCVSLVEAAFGAGHILSHNIRLANAVSSTGYESASGWYASKADLMTEQMVYGSAIASKLTHGANIPDVTNVDCIQLPLFALDPSKRTAYTAAGARKEWWLRDVSNPQGFACVYYSGAADWNTPNNSYGVRPVFGICA